MQARIDWEKCSRSLMDGNGGERTLPKLMNILDGRQFLRISKRGANFELAQTHLTSSLPAYKWLKQEIDMSLLALKCEMAIENTGYATQMENLISSLEWKNMPSHS